MLPAAQKIVVADMLHENRLSAILCGRQHDSMVRVLDLYVNVLGLDPTLITVWNCLG